MKNVTMENETLIKGIIIGFIFSTEIFDEYFEPTFRKRINYSKTPVKVGLQIKMLEMFLDDNEKKMQEIYDWIIANYTSTIEVTHVNFIKHVIHQMQTKLDFPNPRNLN